MNIIEINNLYKEFYLTKNLLNTIIHPFKKGMKKVVLNRINLAVQKSDLFCIVGPNGAGKTTLIKILCSLIIPTDGKVFVNGYDIVKDGRKVRESIGLISGDERSFFWRLSGLDNLKFFAALYNIAPCRIDKEIERVINISGIDEPNKRFQEYSTGTRQRLGIARSLLRKPEILFMDEPTKSLDPLIAASFRELIREDLVKKHKMTVFFTTHHLEEAETMADKLAILDKGEIKAVGKLDDLKKDSGLKEKTIEELYSYYIGQG